MTSSRRSPGYLALYALAYGGGAVLYVPLLTLLLPLKAELIRPDNKLALLGLITVGGALAASVSNIVAGHLSDRSARLGKGRRQWVGAGLVLTLLSLAAVWASRSAIELAAAMIAFQLVLNILLAPLVALAADEVPDAQKGLLGGLIGAAYPFGALAAVVVTAPAGLTEGLQLALVGSAGALAILPFLFLRAPITEQPEIIAPSSRAVGRVRNLVTVTASRWLVQMASLILFAFFLFYFQSVDHGDTQLASRDLAARIAWLPGIAAVLTVPLAILLGRLSDRTGSRRALLAGNAAVAVVGLAVMAAFPQWKPAALGYLLFACSSGVFLALQTTYAMRILPSPDHKGRDLGFLNLANTVPSIFGPWLTLTVVTAGGFRPLMLILAVITALAGLLMLLVREPAAAVDQTSSRQ